MGTIIKKVLVIDDHPIVREGIAQLLAAQHDLCCCGNAVDSASARAAVVELAPDVALLDLSLVRDSGLELIPLLLDDAPGLAVLVLSILAATASPEFHWIEQAILAVGLTIGCVALFIWGIGLPYPLFAGH